MTCINNFSHVVNGQSFPIPCRHCVACTTNKVTELRIRSIAERAYYARRGRGSSFIRVSYNDASLPVVKDGKLYRYGELYDGTTDTFPLGIEPTLLLSDVQKFFHRIKQDCKRKYKIDYRYLYCGEYGTKSTERSHYHLILFGIPDDEAREIVGRQWEFGFCDFKPLESGAVSYCAEYMYNDVFGEEREKKYFSKGKEPPFLHRSNGLGERYFQELIDNGATSFSYMGKNYPFPKYYRQKTGLQLPAYSEDMQDAINKAKDSVIRSWQSAKPVDASSVHNIYHSDDVKIKSIVKEINP